MGAFEYRTLYDLPKDTQKSVVEQGIRSGPPKSQARTAEQNA